MLTSLLNSIKGVFRRGPPQSRGPDISPPSPPARGFGLDLFQGADEDADEFAVTRYPPFDEGIPLRPYGKIVKSQQDLIDRIFRTAGVSRRDFDRLYLPPIICLAQHVHLLPATSKTYFRGTGGLFRMSLDVALNSIQAANSAVFPSGGGVERRFAMQPRWTLAAFLAGLCSQNYRTVNMMAVLTRDSRQWSPLIGHLFEWCEEEEVDRYFVRWFEDDNHMNGAQASAAYSISHIVAPDILRFLAEDNNQVVPAMTAAIAGVQTNVSENPIARLVAPVITRVIEADLKRSANNYGHLVIGAHIETHLIDAMRRLVKNGKWIANNTASGGRVWVGQEGVFLDWPSASDDIANLLTRDSFAGVPKDPDTLADLLVSAKLLETGSGSARYWSITLPNTLELKEGMVKLRDGWIIFPDGYDLTPYQSVRLTLTIDGQADGARRSGPAKQPATVASVPPSPLADQVSGQPSQPPPAATPPPTATPKVNSRSAAGKATEKRRPALPPPADDGRLGADDSMSALADFQPTADQKLGDAATKLMNSLKPANTWLLGELLKNYRATGLLGRVVALPHGLAISHEELNSYGTPIMDLMEELGMKSWLWQDKTRPSRRLHSVEVDGKTLRVVILKPDIATALGFDMTQKD